MTDISFQWGVSSLTHPGETASGDKVVVSEFNGGILVAVIDALGHGSQAENVSELAAAVLVQHAGETPARLIERCHALMHNTRGAAISLASFDWQRRIMSWLGIGNVTGVLLTEQATGSGVTSLLVRSGMVGDQLPALRPTVIALSGEVTLIMKTDGIRCEFTDALSAIFTPQQQAQKIVDDYSRGDDDATALVFRCRCGAYDDG